jgi:putative CocE/NonD family hydrolase
MPDGIEIAVNVRLPDGYVEGRKYPTLFEMSGYDGGSAEGGTLLNDFGLNDVPVLPSSDSRQITDKFDGQYVTIHASVRGTGCSGGEFDLFSTKSAEDGKYIIDQWIPDQSWSNGQVALIGHSYGGITGFMIAQTQPAHLKVATLSGLIDDMYRGITYPGGVANYGFPLAWTGALRPAYDLLGGLAPGILREESDDDVENRRLRCGTNALTKRRTVIDDPLIQGLTDTDSEWFRARSLITRVDRINVPMHITGAYQDEQTGPRGPTHLWEQVRGVPKRLVITNGDHNTQNPAYTGPEVWADRKAWVDHFMGVQANPAFGTVTQDKTSVKTLLELHRDANGTLVPNAKINSTRFPLESTVWTNYYLRGNQLLAKSAPSVFDAPSDTYLSGSRRQAWSYQAGPAFGPPFTTADAPDEVMYRSDAMTQPMAVVGPITANLFVSATAIDTELFVQLIDEGPDGSRTYLQRGLLKASHRAIDQSKSDFAGTRMYRPWRPHTNPQLITPGAVTEYLVEVFPVGHVFRPGHRLLVKISAPPILDSFYAYVPKVLPSLNTVFHTATQPSRLTLPVVPLSGVALGPALPCGAQEAVRCIATPNG